MTLEEFRRYRDESALASYAERWPLLDAERERIWAAIQQAKARITRLERKHERVPANGFVMLKGGYPYVFNDLWTDWEWWLSAQEARKTA